jgi:putative phosphoribosyl transferase
MNLPKLTKDQEKEVVVSADKAELQAILGLPPHAKGIVVFAHGSGSGRFSPRNNFVARILQDAGMATLLADLLEESESNDRNKVFDIDLLANRLLSCGHWLRRQLETERLPLGYFGASTGAGAALQAAAQEPQGISAIVSRGGRPDLALVYLHLVQAPTLLIVGGDDRSVIFLNEVAYAKLRAPKELIIVPKASHLFEEPGALDRVAELARDWFMRFFLSPTRKIEKKGVDGYTLEKGGI